jgi:Protein of unknown function (DUF3618)
MSTRPDTNPGAKSADEVQREVRQSRAEVEEALEAIQERFSPGQLFDQAVDYLRGSEGNAFLRNLGATVRDNPVPVVLMGTGLAWLMLSGPRPRTPYDDREDLLDDYALGPYGAGDYPGYDPAADHAPQYDDDVFAGSAFDEDTLPPGGEAGGTPDLTERAKEAAEAARGAAQGLAEDVRDTAREWSEGARTAARGAREGARRVGTGARHRLRQTGEQLRHGAHGAGARAGHYGRRVRRGFFDTLHEQPLVLGALGLAVGAAIGAALPATETEDAWMGDKRDRLKDRATEAGAEQLDKAGAAAVAAYDAARDEAERQGLTPEGAMAATEAVARKAECVAAAATEAAKTEAQRQKLGQTEEKSV